MAPLVLDANTLMRAALAVKVRALIAQYGDRMDFLAPQSVFLEASTRLAEVVTRRGLEMGEIMPHLSRLSGIVRSVDRVVYGAHESVARQLLARRDESDRPVLATAMALECPIWTEDADFFGCGVATWTSDRVEWYLKTQAR